MSQRTPTKHDGRAVLFAVAELLVLASAGGVTFLDRSDSQKYRSKMVKISLNILK